MLVPNRKKWRVWRTLYVCGHELKPIVVSIITYGVYGEVSKYNVPRKVASNDGVMRIITITMNRRVRERTNNENKVEIYY